MSKVTSASRQWERLAGVEVGAVEDDSLCHGVPPVPAIEIKVKELKYEVIFGDLDIGETNRSF